jgi:hypothetical protein
MTVPEPVPVPHDPLTYLQQLRAELDRLDATVHGRGAKEPDPLSEQTLRELAAVGLVQG